MKQSGQTLIEGIAAVFIILVGIIGALILTLTALSSSTESENQVLAANFAREAMEVIRNKRDSNWLAKLDFDAGLIDYYVITNLTSGSWSIVPVTVDDFDLETCNPTCQLFFNQTTGIYNQESLPGTNQPVNFYRLVQLNNICEYVEKLEIMAPGTACPYYTVKAGIQVVVKVVWPDGNQLRSLILEDRLFNWK